VANGVSREKKEKKEKKENARESPLKESVPTVGKTRTRLKGHVPK
jgi:hypothetical protein